MPAHSPRLVLLVEDHPMVRTLVERSLEADGFEVASYATSKQAIKEFHGLVPHTVPTRFTAIMQVSHG